MAIIRLQTEAEKRKGIFYQFDTNVSPIGEGGMGKVCEGLCVNEQNGFTRPVAIKFMFDDLPPSAYERARREAEIQLRNESTTDTLLVSQSGKEVTLSTSSNLVEFKLKGGSKSIELYTNSDSIVTSNNGLTWYIESKPEWIETCVEVNKKKSVVGKGLFALKGLVSSTAKAATAADAKVSIVKILALTLPKSDPLYYSGRKGEIVFASQDKTYKITVIQQ